MDAPVDEADLERAAADDDGTRYEQLLDRLTKAQLVARLLELQPQLKAAKKDAARLAAIAPRNLPSPEQLAEVFEWCRRALAHHRQPDADADIRRLADLFRYAHGELLGLDAIRTLLENPMFVKGARGAFIVCNKDALVAALLVEHGWVDRRPPFKGAAPFYVAQPSRRHPQPRTFHSVPGVDGASGWRLAGLTLHPDRAGNFVVGEGKAMSGLEAEALRAQVTRDAEAGGPKTATQCALEKSVVIVMDLQGALADTTSGRNGKADIKAYELLGGAVVKVHPGLFGGSGPMAKSLDGTGGGEMAGFYTAHNEIRLETTTDHGDILPTGGSRTICLLALMQGHKYPTFAVHPDHLLPGRGMRFTRKFAARMTGYKAGDNTDHANRKPRAHKIVEALIGLRVGERVTVIRLDAQASVVSPLRSGWMKVKLLAGPTLMVSQCEVTVGRAVSEHITPPPSVAEDAPSPPTVGQSSDGGVSHSPTV